MKKGKMKPLHLIFPIVSKEKTTMRGIMLQSLVATIKTMMGGHCKYYFLHTLNSKIKSLNKIWLL